MYSILILILKLIFPPLSKTKQDFLTEILIQSKQLSILNRTIKRPKLKQSDRLFLSALSSFSMKAKAAISIVKPETVLLWCKKLSQSFWNFSARKKSPGRPRTPAKIKNLIRSMKNSCPFWGITKIGDELKKLGISIHKTTISRILKNLRKNGKITVGYSWAKFITSHISSLFAQDFFTVQSPLGERFFVHFILELKHRKLVQFAVTK